jgi:hypothetical protein
MQVRFRMKSRPRETQSFLLVIAICSLLAVCPAYLQYNDLIEIDFLSPHPSFENLDQENSLADDQSKIKVFVLNPSPEIFLLGIFLGEPIPRLSFQIFSLDHPTAILRC